jgi:integrase
MQDFDGRCIIQDRNWRGDDLSTDSLKSQLDTLRVFLKFCSKLGCVEQDLHELINTRQLATQTNSRDEYIDSDRAEEILTYMRKYEYAGAEHLVFELMWHTSLRRGAIRSIDVQDWDSEESYLSLKHRPETETNLKNREESERPVAVRDDVAAVIEDYLADQRIDVDDDYGRNPLISTANGRIHRTTISTWIYSFTRPCEIGKDCPHDRDPEDCDAAQRRQWAHQCPSSVSSHPVRRGAITHWLRQGWRVEMVSDRSDVSPDTIDEHYDERSELEKMEARRSELVDI